MVLLNVALTCATPEVMFLRSRRAQALRWYPCGHELLRHLLLAGDRPRRTLAGAGVGVGALAAHRQPPAVAQATVAAEVHQPLDVHRDFAPQIALDLVARGRSCRGCRADLGVGQLVDPPLEAARRRPPASSRDAGAARCRRCRSAPPTTCFWLGMFTPGDTRHVVSPAGSGRPLRSRRERPGTATGSQPGRESAGIIGSEPAPVNRARSPVQTSIAEQLVGHLVDRAPCRPPSRSKPLAAIVGQQRRGLRLVGGEPRRTVSALSSLRRTNSVPPQTSHTPGTCGRLEAVVIAGAALGAGEAARDPLDQGRRRRPRSRSPRRAPGPAPPASDRAPRPARSCAGSRPG